MEENNNIEKFFKKRLESQEFSFHETDWLKLEKGLDSAMVTASGSYLSTIKTIVIVVVIITLAFIMGWFARDLFKNNNVGEVLQDKRVQVPAINQNTNNIIPPEPENHKSEKKGWYVEQNGKSIKKIHSSQASFNKKFYAAGNPDNTEPIQTIKMDELINVSQTSLFAEKEKTANYENHFVTYPDSDTLKLLTLLTSEIKPGISEEFKLYGENNFQTDNIQLAANTRMPFRRRWMSGISVAPDFNSVGLFSEKSVTAKFGGQLFFLISPKWMVSTGVFFSNKKYNTNADRYNPPEGYWLTKTNGIIPDNIIGSCRVIDIPVMVTYRFAQKANVNFTTSAGISSFLLLDEKYGFEFSQDNPGAADGWESYENILEAFSMTNISLGVEIQANQRLFLAFEPFLKIPLKEIGWGKVEMHNVGILCTLKYRLWVN